MVLSLKFQKDFDFIKCHGKKKYTRHFIIIYSNDFVNSELSNPTNFFLGLKISRKFSKKAVERNKIRRRIKHIIHNIDKNTLLQNPFALVIIPRLSCKNSNFQSLNNDLNYAIMKILSISD